MRIEPRRDLQQRLLGGQVDADREHARQLRQGALDAADATGAGHAGDGQFQTFAGHPIAGAGNGGEQLLQAVRRRLDARLFAGQVDRGAGDVGHLAQGALDPAGAAGAGHAADRQIESGQIGHAGASVEFRYRINLDPWVRSSAVFMP
ncbi:hypothetical protein D3C84_565680 [compost metagenome]